MGFTVAIFSHGACVGRILSGNSTGSTPCTSLSHLALLASSSTTTRRRNLHLVSAKKESSSRSRKDLPDTTTTTTANTATTEEEWRRQKNAEIEEYFRNADYLPELPGTKPDFFEGPQWDTFGFILQYFWVFGFIIGVIAGVYGAITYNEGATDFKDTPAYKESVESRELFEQPGELDSDVFESNPTEVAPSLD